MNLKDLKSNHAYITLIVIGLLSRLLPHPANFTAVGGVAVFGGSRLPLSRALVVTILSMALSDIFLGFHSLMWATYLGMLGAVMIGHILARKRPAGYVIGASLLSGVFFFLITNLAVFLTQRNMYPKTPAGLVECLAMALPFFRNSILGDIIYTAVFVCGYDLIAAKSPDSAVNRVRYLHESVSIRDTMKSRSNKITT